MLFKDEIVLKDEKEMTLVPLVWWLFIVMYVTLMSLQVRYSLISVLLQEIVVYFVLSRHPWYITHFCPFYIFCIFFVVFLDFTLCFYRYKVGQKLARLTDFSFFCYSLTCDIINCLSVVCIFETTVVIETFKSFKVYDISLYLFLSHSLCNNLRHIR